ncbi:MAG: hypothetical protein ACYDCC_11585 [Actinomycetota bacterium]
MSLLVGWVISAVITACFGIYLASAKNRSVVGWGFLTAIFGLIALVCLAGLPGLTSEERIRMAADRAESYRAGWMSSNELRNAIAEEMRNQAGAEHDRS